MVGMVLVVGKQQPFQKVMKQQMKYAVIVSAGLLTCIFISLRKKQKPIAIAVGTGCYTYEGSDA